MIDSDPDDSPEESPLMDTKLMGEKILNKKAVYEPSSSQRCRQVVCSRRWAVAILVTMGIFLVLIALVASLARPGSVLCNTFTGTQQPSSSGGSSSDETPATPAKNYISTDGRPFPWKDILLPRTVLPQSYHIAMHPNLTQSVFSGTVSVRCHVVSATDVIVMHSAGLNLTRAVVLRGEVGVEVQDQMEYTQNQQVLIKLRQVLAADSMVTVEINFSGPLVSKLAGFYRSTYKTAAGETRVMATTHFEPTDARTAFPCFDEPDLKANFTLTVVREAAFISLFNTPLKSSTPLTPVTGGLVRDEFEASVKMSTYLVAFVVCTFKNVSGRTKDNTLVRVFAPEDQIEQAHYALSVAVKVIDYYNDFFGLPYPLPKQDMIAIPDFAAGAMENWGLITYRMTAILYDPDKTSANDRQWITTVVAHELAHQWFGNIVTMKWWDDLWLNEGFASFVEYLGAGQAEPTFGMEDQFVLLTLQRALYLDSFTSSHPIQVPVTDPAQINEIFDQISYDKGASLIAMAQAFIGEDRFKAGLHRYLTAHAYGNARTDDLWNALQEESALASGVTVKDVMDTWTLQMGYPVVSVAVKPGSSQLTLTQSRFLLTEASGKEDHSKPKFTSPYNYTWKVPFTYCTKQNPADEKLVWLTEKEMTVPLTLGAGDWIKGNLRSGGFYRVNYEPALWRVIIQQLKENKDALSVRDRGGLLDDAFALARGGLLSYDIVFELLGYIGKETEYVPLRTALDHFSFLTARMYLTDTLPKMHKYILDLISGRLQALGWGEQDKHLNKKLQATLLSRAVGLKDKASVAQARNLFANWTSIPVNLRALVYDTGVEYGDDAVWMSVYNNYSHSAVPSEKQQFLYALASTTDPRRIQLFLRDSLDKNMVRSQDTKSVVTQIAGREAGHIFSWRFLQENYNTLYKRYGQQSFMMGSLLKGVIAPFNTQFDYDQVRAFFADKKLGSGRMALEQSLETVASHVSWSARYQDDIARWFQAHANNASASV